MADDFNSLLLDVYRNDPLFNKIEEIYDKWKNYNGHKKIVKKKRNIYWLDLDDKFIKFPNIIFECLTEIDFKTKDSFRLYLTIYRYLQRNGTPSLRCKKTYLLKQVKTNRMNLHRCISELEEKNMLLVDKIENEFEFTLNVAPLNWNVSEIEKEKIEQEVNREINRLEEKWINEDIFTG